MSEALWLLAFVAEKVVLKQDLKSSLNTTMPRRVSLQPIITNNFTAPRDAVVAQCDFFHCLLPNVIIPCSP